MYSYGFGPMKIPKRMGTASILLAMILTESKSRSPTFFKIVTDWHIHAYNEICSYTIMHIHKYIASQVLNSFGYKAEVQKNN